MLHTIISLVRLRLNVALLLVPIRVIVFRNVDLASFVTGLLTVPLIAFVAIPLVLTTVIIRLDKPLVLRRKL